MAAAGNRNRDVSLPAQTVLGCAGISATVSIRSARSGEFLCYFLSSLKGSRFY